MHRRRAAWVWQRVEPEVLVAFALARHVGELYLSVPVDPDPRHRHWLREVSHAVRGWDVRLCALGGDPGWCDDPRAALAWQRTVEEIGVFAGAHLDVEFWTRPDWPGDHEGVADSYLTLVERVGAAGRVECDLPWWLHRHRTADGEPLDAAILERVASVTAMTYRRSVGGDNGLLDIAGPILVAGARTGTPVRLAVDTGPPAPGEEHTSFHGRRASELERALDAVDAALFSHPVYAGIAVHDLRGWQGLPAG